MHRKQTCFIAGHNGMVGSSIMRRMEDDAKMNIVTAEKKDLDLTNQRDTLAFFADKKIDFVFLAAAKVGGIYANDTYPADFIYNNLTIQNNVIHSAYLSGVKRLFFLGSSCIYPRSAPQPISEASLLRGELEPTNEPYAIAKIAGIKLCESYNRQYSTNYISLMPTNLYGPGDNFNTELGHVVPALMNRIHLAKIKKDPVLKVWGTGTVYRELMHVDDMADACVFLLNLDEAFLTRHISPRLTHINVGTGRDVKISRLVKLLCEIIGYTGEILFDESRPDGPSRKLLDVTKIKSLGWEAKIEIGEGLKGTYQWFLRNQASLRV